MWVRRSCPTCRVWGRCFSREFGDGVVQIARATEIAGFVATKVVSHRARSSAAVSSVSIVRNDSVLERYRAGLPMVSIPNTPAAGNTAPAVTSVGQGLIPADGAVAEHDCGALVVDGAANAIATAIGTIAVEGTVVDGQCPAVVNTAPASVVASRAVVDDGAVVNCQSAAVIDAAGVAVVTVDSRRAIATNGAAVERHRAIVADAAVGKVTTNDAVVNRQRRLVKYTHMSISDGQLGNCDVGTAVRDINHSIVAFRINDRRRGARTDNLQVEVNDEFPFCIGSWRDHNRITRRSQRDGMPDGLASSPRRLAIVRVTAVHAVDVPGRAGHGYGRQHEK